ncbi:MULTISPECIES: dephospho-CoA kinase [unclassified Microbacterium]|uniref:dephospho-CoA kinase n=1 Tax=unclassified Microbacterium TaxID=2609290 RepID=UPI001605240C|nr:MULTISPECIES: dephospho-CoA kinase [unclassified Microbacterium]QNA93656.1 dephospho-CoA kinase [Microbacterium sp. Se63.02b]QYM63922.1 dephospho-CoA kinase [Microbacterium sp. Se5.02b]
MRLVAVTGGIGAGKSTVSRALAARGAQVIDADATARRVVDPNDPRGPRVLEQIAALLGAEVLADHGSLDRERVAAVVFHDEELRHRYNAIVHPAIMRATAEEIDAHRDTEAVVVHEIPLLTADTAALPWTYDLIVTVEADAEARVRRLQDGRGYTREHAEARVRAQGGEERRLAIADVVIRTDGSPADTEHRADELWRRLST